MKDLLRFIICVTGGLSYLIVYYIFILYSPLLWIDIVLCVIFFAIISGVIWLMMRGIGNDN